MYEVLEDLNKTSGITGSMLVADDGIVIAADMDSSNEDETVGALASSIISVVRKSMEKMGRERFSQLTIEADRSKMFLADAGVGMLVVTAENQANVGLVRLEMKNAIAKLQENH
jgi:predicted regulator of Ras-like GTPase activity (Roadblock/LC7/MglB family)